MKKLLAVLSAVAIAAAAAPLSVTAVDPNDNTGTGIGGTTPVIKPVAGGGSGTGGSSGGDNTGGGGSTGGSDTGGGGSDVTPDADGGNGSVSPTDDTQTSDMLYRVDPKYTITIPKQIELEDTAKTVEIKASDVVIHDSASIDVSIAQGAEFKVTNGTAYALYSITRGNTTVKAGETVFTFIANGTEELTFTVTDKSNATVAGDYTGTLAFDIKYNRPVVVDPGHTS